MRRHVNTVVRACCADGTKLPPVLIFKRKTLPKDVIPHGIYVHVHSKGWMGGWRRNEAVVRESGPSIQVIFLKNRLY